ncbi:MAG: hypothetical protein JNL74_12235, partial [Fibrobacteres bacterium]|nr:hypothetical protein [Fibrobacterota bacterium]
KTLEKDGDYFVNGYVKVNPGINWIIAAFIDQYDRITYTSVARYVYMDPILDRYRPNGAIWTNGFIASSADDIWKSAPLKQILYSGKDSCYSTFSAYNIAGFTVAGISPEYASYSCLHPDSALTTGNGTPPITGGSQEWKKTDSLPGSGDAPSILFRTLTDSFPYLAYIDSSKGNSVSILRKNSTGFDSIGTTPSNATSYAIAASNDTIYLAFRDNTQSNRITIWKYNGTNWSVIATGAGSGAASAISISFTAIGKPCIAFSDGSRNGKLSLLAYSTTTSSFAVDTTIPLTQAVTATAIAVSNDSRIYTAAIATSGKMHIFNSDTGRWTKTDSLFTASTGTISTISLRASNEIQLAYVDKSSGGYAYFKRKQMNESVFTDAASAIESGDALSFTLSLNPSAANTFFSFSDRLNGSKGTVLYSGGPGDSWRQLEKSGFTESVVLSIAVAVSGKEVPWLLTKENSRIKLYRYGM